MGYVVSLTSTIASSNVIIVVAAVAEEGWINVAVVRIIGIATSIVMKRCVATFQYLVLGWLPLLLSSNDSKDVVVILVTTGTVLLCRRLLLLVVVPVQL